METGVKNDRVCSESLKKTLQIMALNQGLL